MKVSSFSASGFAQISSWLRRGRLSPPQALRMATDLRRRVPKPTAEQVKADAVALREARVAGVLAELDGLTGLKGVKRHVREIYAYQSIGLRRAALGLAHDHTGLHMVFTGNPGTGKTTVARILGRLFKEMGLLPQGHIVEVERADLVGEYIGHTAQKTREVIKRATGGLLFIDEAYSLARGGEKDFGKESIDCLVRAMEEQRAEVVFIFAGYPWEMADFLSQNPGLKSRLPLIIHFPDYSSDELLVIAESMWRVREYQLNLDARDYLRSLLYGPRWSSSGEDGNARAIRNLVERSVRCQALRLHSQANLTREDAIAIRRGDLEQAVREWRAGY